MRTFFMSLLVLILLTAPSTSFCKETSLFERIKLANANVSVIKTAFTQCTNLALFDEPLMVSGDLIVEKPQNLRWEYSQPTSSGFILNTDGGLQWSSTGKNCSVMRTELSPSLRMMANQMLRWVNIDEEALSKDFHIKVTESDKPTIMLRPKDGDLARFIKCISIELPASLIGVKTIVVTEANDSLVTLAFQKAEINLKLEPTTFKKP
ncbi:outer membrane lipoprotein carrier protein LolA [Halodesulfovibrio sp. MK-HDV]|jgi:outer membrane lipoprotein-sorting protein|uniref:LolA family protein n=1 Tax=Halodesulfovibrio sp. MK-HDV TaxID=2599925 RepID=UPI0013F82F67|nr:outer membrane lipoprotein carrier protein LolA [Halodesulfovibrio sp. MK-HDV]KAF1077833.1 Outer-membrane lipoprotein carrier protein [Halodesulfovibrio sp. MK-HDV]